MAKEDVYKLERHAAETERLHVQNKAFNRAVGYLLHPSIHRALPDSPAIAELGTGTGDYMVDIAKTLPRTARLDAYDISSDSFLPKSALPENVTLIVSDAREFPPAELAGKYDVVCIRFMNVGLTPETWPLVAKHAFNLLKPGGVLQWIEGNLPQLLTPLRTEPETKTSALDKISRIVGGRVSQASWFVGNLRSVLEDVGFEDVKQMISSTDRVLEDRRPMGILAVGAFYALASRQTRTGAADALKVDELERMREECVDEIENGAYLRCDMHQFVAWKSL